jgi:hypothetical protein
MTFINRLSKAFLNIKDMANPTLSLVFVLIFLSYFGTYELGYPKEELERIFMYVVFCGMTGYICATLPFELIWFVIYFADRKKTRPLDLINRVDEMMDDLDQDKQYAIYDYVKVIYDQSRAERKERRLAKLKSKTTPPQEIK